MTGHCNLFEALGLDTAQRPRGPATSVPAGQGIKVERSFTINCPAAELYRYWRNFENLPRFMSHLESVKVLSEKRSHWVARGPLGARLEWDAELINERPNELIAWRSLEGSEVDTAGSVHFTEAPGRRGTELRVILKYDPPGGKLGAGIARLFGEAPKQQIQEDLRRFKQVMETGEIPTTHGQPHGGGIQRRADEAVPRQHVGTLEPHSVVEQASEHSFPASDPPAWMHSR
jgi:uncharacterized membrane protein